MMYLRRAMAKCDKQKGLAKDIYKAYKAKGEPGCFKGEEDLRFRTIAGEPGTPQRARLRRRCSPFGPVSFVLESLFLQAAALDSNYEIRQWNQPNIDIWQAPYQHLRPMIQQLCTRN